MGSVRRRRGGVRVTLDRGEAVLLSSLASQVAALLGSDGAGPDDSGPSDAVRSDDPVAALAASMEAPVNTPDDPIVARLLPDAYRDDPEAAGEFRRLTDADLRAEKRASLQRLLDDVTAAAADDELRDLRIEIDGDAAVQWLYALTDIRLALGIRLEVTEDMESERSSLPPGSERHGELAVYDWVTWLQDAVIRAAPDD